MGFVVALLNVFQRYDVAPLAVKTTDAPGGTVVDGLTLITTIFCTSGNGRIVFVISLVGYHVVGAVGSASNLRYRVVSLNIPIEVKF